MHGTLQVTTAIQLNVNKDLGSASVLLGWSGGGVVGDITYKVVRNNVGDPAFPTASSTLMNPDGGTAGTKFTDVGELSVAATRYYLVRNRQITE
jgi:hypothetical protein